MGRTTDTLAFIKTVTAYKVYNLLLLFCSYVYSKWIRKPFIAGLPSSISIEPTTSCNLRCPECPSGLRSFSRPTGMLSSENHIHIINQLYKSVTYINFYFQGEPYLNPSFLDMVKYAVSKNIYCATSTNAHYLNEENARKTIDSGLQRLIISIDGTSQQTYESYRVGGNLKKVLEGTSRMVEQKKLMKSKTPHIIFQFLVVKPNEHQIPEVFKLAEQYEVNEVRLKTAQVYDFKNGNPLIPDNPRYARYVKTSDGTWKIKNTLDNQCWKMWQGCVITWDGKVLPCCFDKDAHYTMGNMLQSSGFNNIWKGEKYRHFRSAILKSRGSIDICTNCTEGTKVFSEV